MQPNVEYLVQPNDEPPMQSNIGFSHAA
jgi:hypothetical protein